MTQILNQIATETAKQAVGFKDKLQDTNSTEFAFWISIVLLVICSFCKYHIDKETTKTDWAEFIIEFPIDLDLVILTILVTIYLKDHIGLGILYIFLSITAMAFCCFTRRKALNLSLSPSSKTASIIWGGATIIISAILAYFMYNEIV